MYREHNSYQQNCECEYISFIIHHTRPRRIVLVVSIEYWIEKHKKTSCNKNNVKEQRT